MVTNNYDVAVVGAGVFGAWSAYLLQRAGARVVLVDGYGPANSRASSGGESRIIRMGYGPDEIYTISAQRSMKLWEDLFRLDEPLARRQESADQHSLHSLFHKTGVLWLAHEADPYSEATLAMLRKYGVNFEQLDRNELQSRYPQLEFGSIVWGILEPDSGVLMARRAVHAVVELAMTLGVHYVNESVSSPRSTGKLESISTLGDRKIHANKFIFACGPWLPKLFPKLVGELIHVTRQEVYFFGVPAGGTRFAPPNLPVWIDFNDLVYAIPNVDGRGLKIAVDAHGPDFDPDHGERFVSEHGVRAIRRYLSERMPGLKHSPLMEARVCQYENTTSGDFLIDLHPDFDNLWLVGGGSGHGFKHGPAVGEYVAGLVSDRLQVQPRFTLKTKTKMRARAVY